MTTPSIKNLRMWWTTGSKAVDLSAQMADGLAVVPQPNVDNAMVLGQDYPFRTVLGVSYQIAIARAFWTADMDTNIADAVADGYVVLFDTTQGWALVTPAHLVNRPADQATSDPASTIRTNLVFTQPEDARATYHASKDWANAKEAIVIVKASGMTVTSGAAKQGKVSLSADGNTLTLQASTGI